MKENLDYMRPRPMGKGELAMLYGPDMTPVSALNRLAKWMRLCPQLMAELQATGYYPRQRLLTVRQVEIIFHHLGQP